MQGSGWPFADHGGEGKALALADLEGRFRAVFFVVVALATNPPLFDHVKSFNDILIRRQHDIAIGVELDGGVLREMRKMGVIHAGERRVFPQKRHDGADVLRAVIFLVR